MGGYSLLTYSPIQLLTCTALTTGYRDHLVREGSGGYKPPHNNDSEAPRKASESHRSSPSGLLEVDSSISPIPASTCEAVSARPFVSGIPGSPSSARTASSAARSGGISRSRTAAARAAA